MNKELAPDTCQNTEMTLRKEQKKGRAEARPV
jgi:hypothetical protein